MKAHTNMYNHSPPSVISISTLLYAPQVLFSGCAHCIPLVAASTRVQQQAQIYGVSQCRDCNNGSVVNYLKLHSEGVRIDPKTKKIMHKHKLANPVRRELDIRKRLHLTHDNKVKVAYQAINLFKGGLTNIGRWDKNMPRV